MGAPYTATPRIGGTAPALPDGDASSLATFRDLLDARAFASGALAGFLDWSGDFAAYGTAPNSFTVELGAMAALALYDGTHTQLLTYAGGTIDQSKVAGGTLGAAVDWWYVYAYIAAGPTLDFLISATEPSAGRRYMSGNATRRYLGCFRTNTSGVPIPVRASHGHYVYRGQQQVLTTGGSATSPTAVIVRPVGTTEEPLVPDHARIASLSARFSRGTGAGANLATVYGNGDTTSTYPVLELYSYDPGGGLNQVMRDSADVELDSQRRFAYAITSASGSAHVEIDCRGWRE